MSDDSFIREVEEELRSDRFKALWKRFGPFIIAGAVLLVLATAAWRGWQAYSESQRNAAGDRFLTAIEAAEAGNREEALAILAALEADGPGRYDLLARMRAAALRANDEPTEAIALFAAIADDASTPSAIADVARVRAGYLLVDHGSEGEVNATVGRLAVEGDPMRHSAREALALAALKAGDLAGAASVFRAIEADQETPPGIAARASEMLAFIRSTEGSLVADGAEATVEINADTAGENASVTTPAAAGVDPDAIAAPSEPLPVAPALPAVDAPVAATPQPATE